MKTFKLKNFKRGNGECTEIVACRAEQAPDASGDWVECDESVLEGLTMLYRQGGKEFYGHL